MLPTSEKAGHNFQDLIFFFFFFIFSSISITIHLIITTKSSQYL